VPKLIALAAPSGGGKSTIAAELMRRHPDIELSVSATTRPKRPVEIDGKHYYFITPDEFQRWIDEGRFIEWEEIFHNRYGTPKSEIDRVFRNGHSILFDVDVKGALSIKRQYPEALLIFIQPPSLEVLHDRLVNRKTESAESIRARVERVPMEMAMEKDFDYRVVNDNMERAVAEVERIVFGE
jgi:guanylate kinase